VHVIASIQIAESLASRRPR